MVAQIVAYENYYYTVAYETSRLCSESANLRQCLKSQRNIMIRDSNPDVCHANCSQNVVDSLACRRQSLRPLWKSAGDCMRNGNPLKNPLFRNGEGVKSDPKSVSGTGSPPKVNHFLRLRSFTETGWLYFCTNPSHRQTDRQNERTTYSNDHITPPRRSYTRKINPTQ